MIYLLFEERTAGCSCSPIEYRELKYVLFKKEVEDLMLLKEEYQRCLEEIEFNAYRKRQKFGNFVEWLIREKGFKEENYQSLDYYF